MRALAVEEFKRIDETELKRTIFFTHHENDCLTPQTSKPKWQINSTPPKPDPNHIVPNRAKCRTRTSIGQFEKMAAVAPYRQLPHNLQMREPKCPT
jgi:hypothetical protein